MSTINIAWDEILAEKYCFKWSDNCFRFWRCSL